MNIAIIGTGYVGLVTGVCFADFGHNVVCVDKDEQMISMLLDRKVPIYEPGLEDLMARNVAEGRLEFTTDISQAMNGAHAVFIAVGTPARHGDGFADLSYVYAAAEEIAQHIKEFTIVVTKSTVPVGTGDEVQAILAKHCDRAHFEVVSNPEFLREGAAIADFKEPDRVVIGTDHVQATDVMNEIYRPISLNGKPILFTSRRTSELIKYAANSFLATKIAFINEISDLCEVVNADVSEVARGIGLDSRIGSRFLQAGPGYGGSCFPKDTLALLRTAEINDVDLSIVGSVVASNDQRKINMADKVVKAMGGNVSGKRIAVLGLAFKQNTDDMRDSPALTIIPILQKAGAKIIAFDPEAMEEAKHLMSDIEYANDVYDCVEGAAAAVVITEWDVFRGLDMARIKSLLSEPNLVDLRNIYSAKSMAQLGYNYVGVGRK
ncbi:UDP-glucose 6-dehydrogenase [Algimonas arctica]|uniref:UDP-glucose 6-dehydrogenase n=1 Tax=Algimonas arctica TaxID=1479486 RepID=A0A8J3CQL4_9PROT|nr:UDP-glucose/GDP-mannose dehydrogenase family protein [Algimonas arctica]GHA85039.1 UDP-glucose 6-dehydrogenase [Algimonas arctica]